MPGWSSGPRAAGRGSLQRDSPALPCVTASAVSPQPWEAAPAPSLCLWQLSPSLREDYTECLQEMLIALACAWYSGATGHSELLVSLEICQILPLLRLESRRRSAVAVADPPHP